MATKKAKPRTKAPRAASAPQPVNGHPFHSSEPGPSATVTGENHEPGRSE